MFIMSTTSTTKKIIYQRREVYLSTLTDEQVKELAREMKKNFEFTNHIHYCVVKNKISKLSAHLGGYTHHSGHTQDRNAIRHLFAHVEGWYLKKIDRPYKYVGTHHDPRVLDVRKGYIHGLCYDVIEIACGFKPVKYENYKERLIQNWR